MFPLGVITTNMWLLIYPWNNAYSFVFSCMDIFVALGSTIFVLMQTMRNKVNIAEFILMRMGYSFYGGWLTAATILNVTFVLKFFGMAEPAFDEELWTVIVLYVAEVIYSLAAFREQNPLYGSVFLWVLYSINHNVVNKKADLELDLIA